MFAINHVGIKNVMECKLETVFFELGKFSNKILEIKSPLMPGELTEFENQYNVSLPDDFKSFLKKYNGVSLRGTSILGFNQDNDSIDTVYHREHFLVSLPQPLHLIPISNDGRGNFYCLDVSNCIKHRETCPVVFWVSNYLYTDLDLPEVVNSSFCEFVKEVLIDWTLESYSYEGNLV